MLGEGSATVSMDIQFRPLAAALNGADTKSAGNSIKHINELWVVVYKNDGTFYEKVKVSHDTQRVSNYQNTELNTSDLQSETAFAESQYCHSTFDMDLPLGKYRIYAVANYDLSSFSGTEDDLKSINLTWNASNIAANNAMFGYFTDGEDGGSAPVIAIDRSGKSLHAWVKRAASKVTVSFDGTNLNENVYIYLHTIQIKDIPTTCWLGKNNSPTSLDQLIADGEIQYLRPNSSTDKTAGIRITKGVPTGGRDMDVVHSETADALFFYENMQGKDSQKHQYNNFESKDNKPYGTYIEVKGYYVNKNAASASQGPIIYRFMLGKNITDDFNAERSCHYKLILKFKNDANDPDWHIEYEPENPEISVPSPMYISYLHAERLDIPVVIHGSSVSSFTATISDNDWYYDGHPMLTTANDQDYNGFLSFARPEKNNSISMNATERSDDFDANKTRNNFTPVDGGNEFHYTVPVYTRAVQLGGAYSGNNAYIHKERKAKVRFTANVVVEGVTKTLSKEIEIIQVKRVVNPTGVWRPYNSTKQFNVVLMESDAVQTDDVTTNDVASFVPTVSDGPWAAEIIQGADWVRISKTDSNYGTTKLTGSTGSTIDFYYKPSSTCSSTTTRSGVIKITYHNNTCIHYVFVMQGSAPVQMGDSQTKWHMTNVNCRGVEESTPLHEGSMFRYFNVHAAIIAENSYRSGYGPYEPIANITYTTNSGGIWTKEGDGGTTLSAREWPLTNDGDDSGLGSWETEYTLRTYYNTSFANIMNGNAKVATCAQWNELKDMDRYYGVLYGDNSTMTKTTADDAYEFPFVGVPGSHTDRNNIPYNYDKGMRGMFVWDRYTNGGGSGAGGVLFFPIGATGHGHRMHFPDWGSSTTNFKTGHTGYYDIGSLKYGTTSEVTTSGGSIDYNRPLLYDLYLSPGAIYWCRDWVGNANGVDDEPWSTDGQNAMDINYHTYDFNTYGELATWRMRTISGNTKSTYTTSSDACYIRCVQN